MCVTLNFRAPATTSTVSPPKNNPAPDQEPPLVDLTRSSDAGKPPRQDGPAPRHQATETHGPCSSAATQVSFQSGIDDSSMNMSDFGTSALDEAPYRSLIQESFKGMVWTKESMATLKAESLARGSMAYKTILLAEGVDEKTVEML